MKTVSGTLKHGLKIGDKTHLEFVMREPTTEDLFEAEDVHGTDTPLKFKGALIARVLVSVGTYTGPFTFGMVRGLKPVDFLTLSEKYAEAEKLGEG
ncbi:phage tail assembly protein [Nevskia ramosa]|uniref:phage tail assembly protein n=1 Tax=Nevskia ramosa TaxID=64002 RepID=UPI00235530DD|nr:phage tail assembly protein [Nevskia ramosa]